MCVVPSTRRTCKTLNLFEVETPRIPTACPLHTFHVNMRETRLLVRTSSCVCVTSGAPGEIFKLHLTLTLLPNDSIFLTLPRTIPRVVPVQHEKDAL